MTVPKPDHDALYHRFFSDPRWQAPVELRELIGLPETSPLWRWQPAFRYHLIDEGAFDTGDLERRDGLPALLFRLENASDPGQLVKLADAVLTWFAGHPGFQAARTVFVEMLGAAMGPHGPEVVIPEALLEVRNMLVTRMEKWREEWKEQWKDQTKREWLREGRQSGEAALLLRLLERRFDVVPEWARDRVLAADTALLEEWGLRVLDAASLEAVFA